METLGRPQDPLVPAKTFALSSTPHMGAGLLATCLTPMESPKPAQGPSPRRAQAPRPSCGLFIALLRKMVWQESTRSWNLARAEARAGTLQP